MKSATAARLQQAFECEDISFMEFVDAMSDAGETDKEIQRCLAESWERMITRDDRQVRSA